MGKLPIILVTGFLGSGKTTFLQRLAESHPDLNLLFLVNEFADSALDAETLEETGLPTQSVVGGSLFCECKSAEFVKVMQERVLALHHERQLDAVIIETSGIANPDAIGRLMSEHGLDQFYTVARIVTIVAPGKFLKLIEHLPVIGAQIVTSDMVVVNKTDLADEETILRAESSVRKLNPDADIVRACYGDVPISFKEHIRQLPEAALATCEANPFCIREIQVAADMSVTWIKKVLTELPPEILRVKGFLRSRDCAWLIERTVDGLSTRRVTIKPAVSKLVLIAHDDHESILQEAADHLRAEIQSSQPCVQRAQYYA